MMIEIITIEQFKALLDYDIAAKIANDRLARIETLNNRTNVLAVLYTELCRKLYVECLDAQEIVEATENPQAPAYVEFISHYDVSNVVYDLMQEASREAGTEMNYLIWFKTTTLDPAYKAAVRLIEGKRDGN